MNGGLYPHGTLYAINIDGWPSHATEVVVQNDRVVRTSWLLEWLRGATTAQLHAAVAEHGWTALAMRAATPSDCRHAGRVVSSLSPPIARRE